MTLSDWTWDPGRSEWYRFDDADGSYNYLSSYKIYRDQEVIHPSTRSLDTGSIPSPTTNAHSRTFSADSGFGMSDTLSRMSINNATAHENSPYSSSDAGPIPYNNWRSQYNYTVRNSSNPYALYQTDASYARSSSSTAPYAVAYSAAPTAISQSTQAYSQVRRDSVSNHLETAPSQPATSQEHQPLEHVQLGSGSRQSAGVPLSLDLGPSTSITEPTLLKLKPGLAAHRKLKETASERERLDPDFKIRRPGRDFFKKGTVFKVLWPELAGEGNQGITIVAGPGLGERIHVRIRWFVVVREGSDCCACLPIQTYQRRGVPTNKIKAHHAIIYSGDRKPEEQDSEKSRGTWDLPMGESIKVIANRPWEKLDPLSRINFVKIYTVEHNVKAKDFGKVPDDDEWKLVGQFNQHWGISGDAPLPVSERTRGQPVPGQNVRGSPITGMLITKDAYNSHLHQQPLVNYPYTYPAVQSTYSPSAVPPSRKRFPEYSTGRMQQQYPRYDISHGESNSENSRESYSGYLSDSNGRSYDGLYGGSYREHGHSQSLYPGVGIHAKPTPHSAISYLHQRAGATTPRTTLTAQNTYGSDHMATTSITKGTAEGTQQSGDTLVRVYSDQIVSRLGKPQQQKSPIHGHHGGTSTVHGPDPQRPPTIESLDPVIANQEPLTQVTGTMTIDSAAERPKPTDQGYEDRIQGLYGETRQKRGPPLQADSSKEPKKGSDTKRSLSLSDPTPIQRHSGDRSSNIAAVNISLASAYLPQESEAAVPVWREDIRIKTGMVNNLIYQKSQICKQAIVKLETSLRRCQNRDPGLVQQLARFRLWSETQDVSGHLGYSLGYRLRNSHVVSNAIINLLQTIESQSGALSGILSGSAESHKDWLSEPGTLRNELIEDKGADVVLHPSIRDQVNATLKMIGFSLVGLQNLSKSAQRMRSTRAFHTIMCRNTLGPGDFEGNFQISEFSIADRLKSLHPKLSSQRLAVLAKSINRRKRSSLRSGSGPGSTTWGDGSSSNSRETNLLTFRQQIESTNSVTDMAAHASAAWVKFPSSPKAKDQETEVRCPYCHWFLPVTIRTDRSKWVCHLEEDLQPYICLENECLLYPWQFDSKGQWADHMTKEHGSRLVCVICKAPVSTLSEHFETAHALVLTPTQLDSVISKSRRVGPIAFLANCPFCDTRFGSADMNDMIDHVANHLLDIAFMSY